MNEKDFLATLIALLEMDEEHEILELMNGCNLKFDYTNVFATKSYQCRAYVDIRVPIRNMKKLKEYKKILFELCKDIFIEDEKYELFGVEIKPMLIKSSEEKEVIESKKISIDNLQRALDNKNYLQGERVTGKTIECIAYSITGDNNKSFYRSGHQLVTFFNEFGYNDTYGPDFPSRKDYVLGKVNDLNARGRIVDVLNAVLDPRDFIDTEFDIEELVAYFNRFFWFDKLMLTRNEYGYKLVPYKDSKTLVDVKEVFTPKVEAVGDKRKLKIFFSYSHIDEEMRNELDKHLVMLKHKGIIDTWYDRVIYAGADFSKEIDENLEDSDIILLLVSVDFLASNYCYNIEMKTAMEMNENKEGVVIPVILRPCDWQSAPFSKLMAVPKDGKSISTWSDRDSAFLNVAKSIENVANSIISKM